MSRQVRHRVAALVLGGLLLGAPLLTNGTANAEQAEAGGRQVVFGGGGVLGLSCRSTPEVGALTVPADSTVRVVNRTGHSAKLQLGGAAKGTVPDDGATDVLFRRGTTAVMLSPSCALGDESTPLLVTATPSAPATLPDPVPTPSGSSSAPTTPSGSGSASTPAGGSAGPGTVTSPARPHRTLTTRPGTARPKTTRPGRSTAAAATGMPPGGATTTRVKTRITRGTRGVAQTFAGMPPGDDKTVVGGVPTLDLPTTTQAAPAVGTAGPSSVAAAEPAVAMEPVSGNGSVGLLGLVAGICVIGVAAGAIRAFVSERASRTTIA
ncbi:MAG TPA: hypothetical protein VFH03_20115 [Actinoplanes sp.]|nr:hypothetical protein [Actinoplanes sp.]